MVATGSNGPNRGIPLFRTPNSERFRVTNSEHGSPVPSCLILTSTLPLKFKALEDAIGQSYLVWVLLYKMCLADKVPAGHGSSIPQCTLFFTPSPRRLKQYLWSLHLWL